MPCLGVPIVQQGSHPSPDIQHGSSVLLVVMDWTGLTGVIPALYSCSVSPDVLHRALLLFSTDLSTREQSILGCRRGFRAQLCTLLLFLKVSLFLFSQPTTLPQGTINMNQCTDVVDGESRTGQKFSLCILTPEKEHFIRAENKEIISG